MYSDVEIDVYSGKKSVGATVETGRGSVQGKEKVVDCRVKSDTNGSG